MGRTLVGIGSLLVSRRLMSGAPGKNGISLKDTTCQADTPAFSHRPSGLSTRPKKDAKKWPPGRARDDPSFDRFWPRGRVTDHKWLDGTPDIVSRHQYTYDRNSNRLTRTWEQDVEYEAWKETYTYDGLNRLGSVARPGDTDNIEETKVTASDEAAGDVFGYAVAISGNLAIVGAYGNDDDGSESGAAYIFRDTSSGWQQEAKLTASDAAAGDSFGCAVAISGNVVIVGALGDDSSKGAAYIFRYNGSTWTQEQKLTASDGATNDAFGASVSISGNVAIVGAPIEDDYTGAAYIYRYDGSDWDDETKITASDGEEWDDFGVSVSISGNVAIVGAEYVDSTGAAYIYRYDGSDWDDETKLTASDGANWEYFGWRVAVSGDVAIVGANFCDDKGAAYIYRWDGSDWDDETKVTASDGEEGDTFGSSVAICGDVAVVGAGYDDGSGSAYVFRFDGSDWDDETKLTASDGATGDLFGGYMAPGGVAVSGETALVSAYGDDDNGSWSGSAYFYAGVDGSYLDQDWTFDALGNWSSNEKNHVEQDRTHTAGKANEIAEVDDDDTHVAHDAAGNMTKIPIFEGDRTIIGHHVCVYDAWNRLVKVQTDASTPADIAVLAYDALGRRIKKTITISGDWNNTYHFYYNGYRMIETRNGSDLVIKQHVWGQLYVDELIQIGLNDDPSDESEGTGSQCLVETFYYAAHDANFNITNLFEADGDLAERYAYTPYGRRQVYKPADGSDTFGTEAIPHSQPWVISTVDQSYGLCDIGHQGLLHDKEFGLIYNRARYLHPLLGRFLQSDPLGYVDGANLYEYLRGNPSTILDPSGTRVVGNPFWVLWSTSSHIRRGAPGSVTAEYAANSGTSMRRLVESVRLGQRCHCNWRVGRRVECKETRKRFAVGFMVKYVTERRTIRGLQVANLAKSSVSFTQARDTAVTSTEGRIRLNPKTGRRYCDCPRMDGTAVDQATVDALNKRGLGWDNQDVNSLSLPDEHFPNRTKAELDLSNAPLRTIIQTANAKLKQLRSDVFNPKSSLNKYAYLNQGSSTVKPGLVDRLIYHNLSSEERGMRFHELWKRTNAWHNAKNAALQKIEVSYTPPGRVMYWSVAPSPWQTIETFP